MARCRAVLLLSCSICGCSGPALPDGSGPVEPVAVVTGVRPPVDARGVSPNARFDFELPAGVDASNLRLFEGELSDYHQRRVVEGILPATLEQREISFVRWGDSSIGAPGDAGTQRVAAKRISALPRAALQPGTTHTWALLGQGPLLAFSVAPAREPALTLYWPTAEATFAGYAAYCGDDLQDLEAQQVQFEPRRAVSVQPGLGLGSVGTGSCVHLQVEGDLDVLVPPVQLLGHDVESTPLEVRQVPETPSVGCEVGWQPVAAGCARPLDDRLLVAPPAGSSLWLFESGALHWHHVAHAGEAFALRGLRPTAQQRIEYVSLLADGSQYRGQLNIQTSQPVPHVVINEVLANPLGSEPAQEWVELYNDGMRPVQLGGWAFSDSGATTRLPEVSLESGTYLLLVAQGFSPGGPDFWPQGEVGRIVLPALGKSGLSNGGEELRLSDSSGKLMSRFPALPAAKAGVSIARRAPDAPDERADSFAVHAAPGASPGFENGVVTP